MIEIRRDNQIHDERGEWFRARWHFSFHFRRDQEHDGFGAMMELGSCTRSGEVAD